MVFAVTHRWSGSTNTYVASRTSGSFTPTANSQLFVFVWSQRNMVAGTNTITDSAGLDWGAGPVIEAGPTGSFIARLYLWRAEVGSSPVSMTVTINSVTNNSAPAMAIFDVTGAAAPTSQVDSNMYASASTIYGGPLPTAAQSGNLVICGVGINNDSGLACPVPSGWTTVTAPTGAWETVSVSYSTSFAATTTDAMTSTDGGNSSGTFLMELAPEGTQLPGPPVSYVGTSNVIKTDGTGPGAITPHASTAVGDLLVFYHYSATTGGNETVDTSTAGFTDVYNVSSTTYGTFAAAYRFRATGDTTYTFGVTNHATGTTGETIIQWVETYRYVDPEKPIGDVVSSTTDIASHTTSIGPISATGINRVDPNGLLIVQAGRHDDLATISQTTLTGDSLTWTDTNVQENTSGADAAMMTQRGLNATGAPLTSFTSKTITTPATPTAALGKGGMFVINAVRRATKPRATAIRQAVNRASSY